MLALEWRLGATMKFGVTLALLVFLGVATGSPDPGGDEASAIGALRAINAAQSVYASACGRSGYAASLADLAKAPAGATSGFVAPDLGLNIVQKSGYIIRMTASPGAVPVAAAERTCNATESTSGYFAVAVPNGRSHASRRSFATDQRGSIVVNRSGAAIAPDMSGTELLK